MKTQVANSNFHRGQKGNVAEGKTARWQTGEYRPQAKGTVATQLPLIMIIEGYGSRVATFSREAKCLLWMSLINLQAFKYWCLITALGKPDCTICLGGCHFQPRALLPNTHTEALWAPILGHH